VFTADDSLDWNVLVMAEDRSTHRAAAHLGDRGVFRPSRHPRVLVGRVAAMPEFLDSLAADVGQVRRHGVCRVIPLERSLLFERDDVTETLCFPFVDRAPTLAGAAFFVRANLRGMKGRLEHPAVERALGAVLLDGCERVGRPGTIRFRDPDVVVVAEVVGARVGYAFLDREARAHPLVRVR
jgi:hypothetical protein